MPPFEDDISTADTIFDFTRTVTHRDKSRIDGDTDDSVANALLRMPSLEELALGLATYEDVIYSLPQRFTATKPKRLDQIIDGLTGVTWVIKQVDTATLANRYRCICKRGD